MTRPSPAALLARGFAIAIQAAPTTTQALCDELCTALAALLDVRAFSIASAGLQPSDLALAQSGEHPYEPAAIERSLNRAAQTQGIVRQSVGQCDLAAVPLPGTNPTAGAFALIGNAVRELDEYALETAAMMLEAHVHGMDSHRPQTQLEQLALTDGLTGIPNRRAFDDRLLSECNRACRGGYSVGGIMIDVDFFGAYNNRYGHPAGDACLKRIATALHEVVNRDTDMLARYGGEEFAVILPATDLRGTLVVAERIRVAIDALDLDHRDTRLGHVTVSVGAAAEMPATPDQASSLFARADEMLLQAKNAGRNRVVALGYESDSPHNKRRYDALHNLPPQITPFLGRSKEVEAVSSLVDASRLVSLVGQGGVGKTRLAAEVMRRCTEHFADGSCFVDLSTIQRAEMVATTVASALALQVSGPAVEDAIVAQIADSHRLLVLDNLEHIADAAAAIIGRILKDCDNVHILTTTRQSIDVVGEVVYRLSELSQVDARSLLRSRLHAAHAEELHDTAADAELDAVCEGLDRLPLAIEIVAPRAAEIGLAQTLSVLQDRDFLLTASLRGEAPRQRTLSNLLQWSYQLLSEPEQALLRSASVFFGGMDETAVAYVCSEDLDLLVELERKSLITKDAESGRFRMPDITRDFALQRLHETGVSAVYYRKHASYFSERAKGMRTEYRRGSYADATAIVRRESANFVAALEYLFDTPECVEAGAILAANLTPIWERSGYLEEARYWLGRALGDQDHCSPTVTAEIYYGNAIVAVAQGDHTACIAHAEKALELLAQGGDRQMLADTQALIAHGKLFAGEYEQAELFYAESLDNAEAVGDKRGISQYLVNLGNIALEWRDDVDAAAHLYRAAIDIFRGLGAGTMLPVALLNYGGALYYQEKYAEAIGVLQEAIELFSQMGHKAIGVALTELCACYTAAGNFEAAHTALVQAVEVYTSFPTPRWITFCLQHAAKLAQSAGDTRRSVQLLSFFNSYREKHQVVIPRMQARDVDRLGIALEASCSAEELWRWRREGSIWTLDDAFESAQAWNARNRLLAQA